MNVRNAKWPKIRRRGYPNGRVSWQVDAGLINGKRARKQFPTKEEADAYAQQVRVARSNEGLAAFSLLPNQRVEAEHCFALLEGSGATLTEAVRFFLDQRRRRQQSRNVNEVVISLLMEKGNGNLREDTLRGVRGFHKILSERFGARPLSDLTVEDLATVCNDPLFFPNARRRQLKRLEPKTVRNRIGWLTDLYNHAIRNAWAEVNLASKIRKPAKQAKEPGVLLVDEAARLVGLADEFQLLPYVAMGLFAGIRRAELMKLDWDAVKLIDMEIVIGASIAKARSRRVIPINPTLAAWLQRCHREHGPVVDRAEFEKRFRALRKAAAIEKWRHNAIRHSYASYHLVAHKDPTRTAYLMGHREGTEMLDSHYKSLVSSIDAERYWKLLPGPNLLAAAA